MQEQSKNRVVASVQGAAAERAQDSINSSFRIMIDWDPDLFLELDNKTSTSELGDDEGNSK